MIERHLATVVAVATDRGHHFSKPLRDSIDLVQGLGIEGDAHAGLHVRHRYLARRRPRLPNLRQVHLIPVEIFAELRTVGYDVGPGELGENITVAGLELERLPLGTVIRLGTTAAVELTGLRTPCVLIDRFQPGPKSRMIREDIRSPSRTSGWAAAAAAEPVAAAFTPAIPFYFGASLRAVARSPQISPRR
jgi:hypothetical protein